MTSGFLDVLASGEEFPVDRISSIARAVDGRYVVRFKDRDSVHIGRHAHNDLMRRPVQLMPCEPGTSVITFDRHDGTLARYRLIAWALCMDGEIRIVTPGGVNDGVDEPFDGFYVEHPNGSIQGVGLSGGVAAFDDAAAMLRHFRGEEWDDADRALVEAEAALPGVGEQCDDDALDRLTSAYDAALKRLWSLPARTAAQAIRKIDSAYRGGDPRCDADIPAFIAEAQKLATDHG